MNDRKIKELEAQCWEPRKYGPAWFNAEKFAELIVRECARIIDRGDGEVCSIDEWVWCNKCRDDIIRHFGLK